MAAHDMVVYSAAMSFSSDKGFEVPGYVYFCGHYGLPPARFLVFSQRSPSRYPVSTAIHHGQVGSMRIPLPRRPTDYEVCFYYDNLQGSVDCYLWRPTHPPSFYVRFEVVDISDPLSWHPGSRYVYRSVVTRARMSRRHRTEGLWRFYRVMGAE